MEISESTDDHGDKTNTDYDLPWPRVIMIPRTLHTNTPFFRDLLSDLKTFGKFLNLDGICSLVSELLECAENCQCSQRSNDNENGVGLDGNSPAGMLGAGTLDFIVIEEWIPRINTIMAMWVKIRQAVKARAEHSRNKAKDRMSSIHGEARRRFLRGFAPAVDLVLMELGDTSSSPSGNDTSESDSDTDSEIESDSSNSDAEPESASHLVMEEEFTWTEIATDGVQLGVLLRRLPSEVLHDVILKAQDSDPHIQLTLSHVNQYFRTLVIASPLLWCKLDALYPRSLVSLYLERSAEATLEVVVEQGLTPCRSPVLDTRENMKVMNFYDTLQTHCHRVRRLRVQGQTPQSWQSEGQRLIRTFCPDLPDPFHWSSMLNSLEYLDLGFRTWDLEDCPQWPAMSNLQGLRLYGSWPPSVALLIPPSLKHLTLENQRELTLEITKKILASTAALESLRFSDVILVETRGISEIVDQPVQMASLRSLSVTRCTGETAKKLVQNVVCTNLEDLSIHFTGEPERSYQSSHGEYRTFQQTDLTSLTVFNTPHPKICKLDLVACEAQPIFLEKILDNLPGLRELKIGSAALTNNHLKALVITPTFSGVMPKSIRCPLLVSLHLDNELAIGSNIIRHIARSRNEASIPLRSVTLRGFDLQKVFLEDLECIRESGVVDLTVTVFGKEEDHESEKDPDWSSSWSTDEEPEDELAFGDEEILAD